MLEEHYLSNRTLNRNFSNYNKTKDINVLAVASGKGGVGKTNIAINLALALLHTGKKTWLMDTDLGLSNIDVLLGIKPVKNLYHVINGQCTLNDIILSGPSGLKVIPSASGIRDLANLSVKEQAGIIWALSELDEEIDILVVDIASGISDSALTFARACQEIIIVVCDEPTSITDAYALIKVLSKDFGVKSFRILANMCANHEEGIKVFKKLASVAGRFLDVSLDFIGTVPFDPYLQRSIKHRIPVVNKYPSSKSSKSFKNIAKLVDNWSVSNTVSGNMQFFLEKLVCPGIYTGERIST